MLTLLLGEDIFAKQAFLDTELANLGLELTKHRSGADLPKLSELGGASLFGPAGAHVFIDCVKDYELADLEQAALGEARIYFWENSLDKRLTKTKQLIKIASVKEFPAPVRDKAQHWIQQHAELLEIKIQPSAAGELARRLLGDTKTTLPVVGAHHELLKLSSYAGKEAITTAMVEELTAQDLNIDLFALLNFIGAKNKQQATKLLQNYFENTGEDEKTSTIRLVALLSDQLRSMLIVKDLSSQGLSDAGILQATGWKSGRLFIMKKLGSNFTVEQLQKALTKLYSLDKELKTSTLPPRVIINMIVAVI
ncbi:MAG TPA: hypothetical protein PKD79_01090 [Candidatus Doudnabacteria bacterium]|nr:hypothetical protein [Candidatus Doudnabacteria bacterium]